MKKLLEKSVLFVMVLAISIVAFRPLFSLAAVEIAPILIGPTIIGGTVNASSTSAVTVTGSIASGVTATNLTYPNDGDAAIYNNTGATTPDASQYRCGTFAQNTGAFATLLQNMPNGTAGDFAHYYCSHNFPINPITGAIGLPDDPTSTSYVEIFGSDAGKQAVFYAPASSVVVLNTTPTYALNMASGVVSAQQFYGALNNYVGTAGGTVDAITLTPTVALTSYAGSVGASYVFKASGTNAAAPPTINISGLGALNTTMGNVSLPSGGILSGNVYVAIVESATSIRVSPWDSVSPNGDTLNGSYTFLAPAASGVGTGPISASAVSANTGGNATTAYYMSLQPSYNQTGTAAATDIYLNRTGTTGSGNQYLMQLNVGGVNKLYVDLNGNLTIGSSLTSNNGVYALWWDSSSGGRFVNTGTTAITIPAKSSTNYLSSISATGVTITLAAPAIDGERRRIVFGGASTGITWAFTAPATAQVGLPTTVTAGQSIEIVYNSVAGTPANSAATTWYQY